MITDDIDDLVIDIVAEHFELKPTSFTNEEFSRLNFKKDLCADSLDFIELCIDLEDEFNIALDDELVERLDSVYLLIEHVKAAVRFNEMQNNC